MHPSSIENMDKCYRKYIEGMEIEKRSQLKVLDIGGRDVNGSYSEIFNKENVEYIGTDIEAAEGVSIVLDDPNVLPLKDNSIDVVISGQMLEHCPNFWRVFSEMVRVLRDDGYLFLIAPSAGEIHRFPVDCYRFYPDSYKALADYANCFLIDCWLDSRGPWNDLVGVFNKSGKIPKNTKYRIPRKVLANNNFSEGEGGEKIQGSMPYLDVLKRLHELLKPRNYLEIGVRQGLSLSLSACKSIGVDPDPQVIVDLPVSTKLIKKTSDEFFENMAQEVLKEKLDLVFIDGMHLFEYVLRDFMNVELLSDSKTIVVVDDIYPNASEQASRERKTKVWTGDVWKLYYCLKEHRKDLCIIPVDTSPTGLILITGLDAGNRVLWDSYNPIVRKIQKMSILPPEEILNREQVIDPSSKLFSRILENIKESRFGYTPKSCHKELEFLMESVKVRLSIIVISYNMKRELPRTLKTLSEDMQIGVSSDEYEIIVVDNGSSQSFDESLCRSICSNIKFVYYKEEGSVSPVGAINKGLSEATGEMIGVMIDGARMVSPGLIVNVLEASKIHQNVVIGTLSFHLGVVVQHESIHEGYNQSREDELLDTVDWKNDGYQLFDISVFAGSSRQGWFSVPAESNAFFMRRPLWEKLGGFDSRFQQPGGGLANLDTWFRACAETENHVVMLLGEATFHQFHGGVATNSLKSNWREFNAEYKKIRGCDYVRPFMLPTYFSVQNPNLSRVILNSK